ncbi:hypothetical protein KFE25_002335 [Diacronema lutheri]|uniref:Uncharacterized protein n=1 Tax=Diacronema lutheri TaxID=2081491 RepID=A0A8J5X973_DIALT|nr:hypothetical protein KFE25_002335 [Diacronema lutheri]
MRDRHTASAKRVRLRSEGIGGAGGSTARPTGDALRALGVTKALVAIVSGHWSRALRRPAGAHTAGAHGGTEARRLASRGRHSIRSRRCTGPMPCAPCARPAGGPPDLHAPSGFETTRASSSRRIADEAIARRPPMRAAPRRLTADPL